MNTDELTFKKAKIVVISKRNEIAVYIDGKRIDYDYTHITLHPKDSSSGRLHEIEISSGVMTLRRKMT